MTYEIHLITEEQKEMAKHLKKSLILSDSLIKACEGEQFLED